VPPGGETAAPPVVSLRATPNPFHAGVTIHFALPSASEVDVAVYDLSGRLVRSLDGGRLAAGAGSLTWDGRDQSGRAMGGGIYFIRLRAGDVEVQTKVVKVR
jgi:flagellar hook assembly protein FlgD